MDEKDFIKEYEELLKKYNVSLFKTIWSDEWGYHADIYFKENGKYCNINYTPDIFVTNKGHCGMGG